LVALAKHGHGRWKAIADEIGTTQPAARRGIVHDMSRTERRWKRNRNR
jgi:hypothetical protein